jgi:hypothetical protein
VFLTLPLYIQEETNKKKKDIGKHKFAVSCTYFILC